MPKTMPKTSLLPRSGVLSENACVLQGLVAGRCVQNACIPRSAASEDLLPDRHGKKKSLPSHDHGSRCSPISGTWAIRIFCSPPPLKPAPELHANRRRRQSSGKSLSARLLQPGRNTRLQGDRKKAGDLRHDVLHANAHAGKRFSLLVPVFAASLPGPSVRRKDAPSVPPFCAIKHKKPPWKRGLFSGGKDQFSHFPFT